MQLAAHAIKFNPLRIFPSLPGKLAYPRIIAGDSRQRVAPKYIAFSILENFARHLFSLHTLETRETTRHERKLCLKPAI